MYLIFWNKTHQRPDKIAGVKFSPDLQKVTPKSEFVDKNEALDLYQPQDCLFLNYDRFESVIQKKARDLIRRVRWTTTGYQVIKNGFFSQFYAWNDGYKHLLISKRYDIVVKTRFDVFFRQPLNLDSFNPYHMNAGAWNGKYISDFF